MRAAEGGIEVMEQGRTNSTSRLIEGLFGDGSAAGMADEQLLRRFASRRDPRAEYAFEVLVQRHGPMVLAVCRSALRDIHDAEDAFQATFLVLARKAATLSDPGLLGPWLHAVARHTAQRLRTRRARMERLVQWAIASADLAGPDEPDKTMRRAEESEHLNREIGRLPERYRIPVLLCYFEGLTHDEAARRLGWPIGTVSVRLMRARDRLRRRLTRLGLAPTASAVLPLVPIFDAPATPMVAQTTRAAVRFATGDPAAFMTIPSQVRTIATGVLRTMMIKKLAVGFTAFLACGLIAVGSIALARQAPPKRPSTAAQGKSARKADAPGDDVKSIVANGSFERGDPKGRSPESWKTGPAIPGVEFKWDKSVAHQGKASLHLKKTAARFFPIAQCFQEVKRAGDLPRLKVAAFVKAEKATKAVIDVQFVSQNGDETHQWVALIAPKADGDPPLTHDWKRYEGIVDIPAGTDKLAVAVQIYGPGNLWFDEVTAEYTNDKAPPGSDGQAGGSVSKPEDERSSVASEERKAGDDARKRYFLIGPAAVSVAPAAGYRLLIVLPGGDGSPEFQPFVKRIAEIGVPPGYLIAQMVAFSWTPDQAKQVVWPTAKDQLPKVGFTTEAFVDAVVTDVALARKLDRRYVFTLGWSSGGPPVYATSLQTGTKVTGTFAAMSVFVPAQYPPLKNARGQAYYLLHSPQDFIPIRMAETARDELRKAGAKTELQTYEGGHGWHGDVYGEIRRGVEWLEKNCREAGKG
jgi:RNA polymerase sigma factor (sigma-70 family)